MADEGHMTIWPVEAKFKVDHEKLGKQDPYCMFSLREEDWKSTTAKNMGKTPVWPEDDCNRWKVHYLGDDLKIKFFDEEVFKDKHIGHCTIKLSALTHPEANPFDEWFPIDDDGEEAGKIHLKAHWEPNE